MRHKVGKTKVVYTISASGCNFCMGLTPGRGKLKQEDLLNNQTVSVLQNP